jgi:diacylglycerol kinase family enzyme
MVTQVADVVVVYNPRASRADEQRLHRIFRDAFADRGVDFCQCSPDEDMAARLAPWLQNGARLVIAAGGDGTVSDVAQALVHKPVVLGILPQGTSNVLARELRLPLNIEKAAALLAAGFRIRTLDVLKVADTVCLLGVSVGLSASAMMETDRQQKKLFGPWAYWIPFARRFFNTRGHEFKIRLDGAEQQLRASDILVMNAGAIGFRTLRWGADVQPDDGVMNFCYLRARTGLNYVWTIMNFLVGRYIRTDWVNVTPLTREFDVLEPRGLAFQGDGDTIGKTPFTVKLDKAALQVAVENEDHA